ncbi:hypothetical protein QOZ80_2AG0108790 [Eleusine coracana subsp. coracana]|nr:hypothetical protein QOZ80_2AG0108790 [Eleusine coracana subsp. coracana]
MSRHALLNSPFHGGGAAAGAGSAAATGLGGAVVLDGVQHSDAVLGPRACCSGIQNLLAAARDRSDRYAICTCLKDVAAGAAGGPYISRAAGLPGRCGVTLPYKLGPKHELQRVRRLLSPPHTNAPS